MDVKDSVFKFMDIFDVVNALVGKVARIQMKTEGWMVLCCLQCSFCGNYVERDFCGMQFQGEFNS